MAEFLQKLHNPEGYKFQKTKSRYLKLIFIIFLLIISLRAAAPEFKVFTIIVPQTINPYERLVTAIVKVESSGDNLAFNQIENATGAFQIRPIRLRDYNQRTGSNYQMDDCYNYEISKKIFLYYAVRIGFSDIETIAKKWNGSGIKTKDYWEKIKLYL